MGRLKHFVKSMLSEDSTHALSAAMRFCDLKLQELGWHIRCGHGVRRKRIREYLGNHRGVKVHFGCGGKNISGFLNSDLLGEIPINICRRLPFPDQSVDLIYSSHVVEHVHENDFRLFLRESHRIMKASGVNIIATPTIEKAVSNAYSQDGSILSTLMELDLQFMSDGFVGPSTYLNHLFRWWDHKCLYDEEAIRHYAKEAGFSNVERVPNLEVPDEDLRTFLANTATPRWLLETETFLVRK